MGWLTIDVPDEIVEAIRQKAKGRGQSVDDYLTDLVSNAMAMTESRMENQRQQPGKHSTLATKLLDEAARLRAKAREILHEPPPPPPGTDKTETFAKLWTEAWRHESGLVVDRLGDAAKILEDAVGGISPTHDLLNWRR